MGYSTLFGGSFGKSSYSTSDVVFNGEPVMDLSVELESKEIDMENMSMEHSVELLGQLSDLYDTAATFAGNGMHPDGAVFFVSTAEKIRTQLGVPVPITASMESFSGGMADCTNAIDVSLASIGDTLKEGWNIILEAIKKMIDSIKNFIAMLADKMPSLKKRAEALKEKAGDVSGTAENSKIKIGDAFSRLAKPGNQLEFNLIPDTLKALGDLKAPSKLVESVNKANMEKLDASADELKKPSFLLGITDVSLGSSAGLPETAVKDGFGVDATKNKVETTKELCGDKYFVYTYSNAAAPTTLEQELALLASRKFGLRSGGKSTKFDKEKEVPTLSGGEVETLCDAIIAFAENFERSKGEVEASRKESEKMLKLAEKLKTLGGKSDYADVKSALNKAKSAIQSQVSLAANPYREVVGYGYGVAQAALVYGEKSLAQYK